MENPFEKGQSLSSKFPYQAEEKEINGDRQRDIRLKDSTSVRLRQVLE